MNAVQKTFQLTQIGMRRFATTNSAHVARNLPPGYEKLKAKMEKFQVDDGVPVYIKGGMMDRLLYKGTLLLCGVGLILTGQMYYTLLYGKK